ncbi:MAG: MetS family NSS transporter small subunit [Acidobacteriota bacterium]
MTTEAIVIMIVILTAVWGGFGFFLTRAILSERGKRHD